jgi:hypothetical protein
VIDAAVGSRAERNIANKNGAQIMVRTNQTLLMQAITIE